MLKPRVAQPAQPAGDRVGQHHDRVDVLARALEQAHPEQAQKGKAKAQRSREGMVSFTLWMMPEARKELKAFCIVHKDEQMESFILRAVNKLLAEEGATFQIK